MKFLLAAFLICIIAVSAVAQPYHWQRTNIDGFATALAIHGSSLVASVDDRTYFSTNKGASWKQSANGDSAFLFGVHNGLLYAEEGALGNEGAIWKSSDG